MNDSKKTAIKNAIKATRERRSNLCLKVYTLKLDKSHLSKKKLEYLNRLFTEAKWLYNHLLSLGEHMWSYDTKNKHVCTLDKDKNVVPRMLDVLSSQMRQTVFDQLKKNIFNLSKAKKSGRKTGRLKYKSSFDSIRLKQSEITYQLNGKYLSLQGFKGTFKLEGLRQLDRVVEIGEARLVRQAGDFYLKVTCYEQPTARQQTGKEVGLDFGIKTTLTTSDNEKINIQIGETERLRKLSKGLNKKTKGSHNRFKQKTLLQKEYVKICDKKRDIKNKVVHDLITRYDVVCIQDENIEGWKQGRFGRQVQRSVMGGIISDLKNKSVTRVVDRWFPSTKLCEECGILNVVGLSDRVYVCPCGHEEDRDLHAAKNIRLKGLHPLWCVGGCKNACGAGTSTVGYP